MYRIIDSYGTNQTCWRWSEALDWLNHASPEAAIVNRLTGRIIAIRAFVRMY